MDVVSLAALPLCGAPVIETANEYSTPALAPLKTPQNVSWCASVFPPENLPTCLDTASSWSQSTPAVTVPPP
nr:MAG TPA: hypothetical protein [Caudoviricetes sp.]